MIYKKGYVTKSAVDCFSSCLLSYLNYASIDFSLEEAFICGGGLKLRYKPGDHKYLVTEAMITDIYIKAMAVYDIPLRFGYCTNEHSKFIADCASNECMLILRLSTSDITYHTVFQQNAEMGHFINVIGYDKNTEMVYISDGYVPTRIISTYEGWMDIHILIEMWKKKGFAYAVLDMKQDDMNSLTIKADSFNDMNLFYKELKNYVNGSFCKDRQLYTGYAAVDVFAENLIHLCDLSSAQIADITYKMIYNIKILGFSIGKNCILKVLHNHESMNCYEEEYLNIIKDWDKLLLHILKIKYYHSEDYVNNVIKNILDLNKKECLLIRKIITLSTANNKNN